MSAINIERLSLQAPGLSARDGERLARLVAEGLGAASLPKGGARRVESLQVNVNAGGGADVERLARQVVADLLRQLSSSL